MTNVEDRELQCVDGGTRMDDAFTECGLLVLIPVACGLYLLGRALG